MRKHTCKHRGGTHSARADTPGTRDLAPEEIAEWRRMALLASVAYCTPEVKRAWACEHCTEAGDMRVLATGGDHGATPWYYLASNTTHLFLAIEGTNSASPASRANSASVAALVSPSLHGRLPDAGRVHPGFLGAFERLADPVLAAVRAGLADGAGAITVLGHSLGAAVGQFAAVYLAQETGVPVQTRLFGPPRVGTKGWADLVDAKLANPTTQQVIHSTDVVPHLARREHGFERSGGEVWISPEGSWIECAGRENEGCADGVPEGERGYAHHSGPFDGVWLGWGCYSP